MVIGQTSVVNAGVTGGSSMSASVHDLDIKTGETAGPASTVKMVPERQLMEHTCEQVAVATRRAWVIRKLVAC